ncbi:MULTISPECIES: DUF6779 domain-containing protein [unclassified Rhodococcus (in: high G+C Gram-positive bacteria)]|jgi:hypothetical protein|uniref:DUF6779 domain-containing protein n=1 Tax=unclassified Rhodococcus (in: high G+C Gram-positive bacteria) TaxID=192944 RepID=UPI00131FDCE9|nr:MULTISPECIES: DUF6779 domain-containing protein [unclassified Rhodococcus (in: high G+C Gram-positive bacteria)]QHE67270.1 putative conserved transmembrane protein rich in alanine and arginite and proline [Rhodococcus sp. WAY2]
MTNPGRLKSARRNQRSASQMIVAALLALAVVASLFLIFSESVPLLRVGVVVALWAATLGAIAMTKYRRESALDKAKVNDLQTVYELQLEREISARREYELTVEKRVRSEVRADAEELAALRAELSSLRKSLEALFDGAMPTERIALRADSTRVQELAGGSYSSYQPAPSGLYIPGAGYSGHQGQQSGGQHNFANPDDEPVTAETSIVDPDNRGYAEAEIEVEPEPEAAPEAQPESEAQPEQEPEAEAQPEVEAQAETEPEKEPEAAPQPEVGAQAEDEPVPGSRRARRQASEDDEPSGAHASGLSVAEIMANMHSTAGTAQGTGRRRRREAE